MMTEATKQTGDLGHKQMYLKHALWMDESNLWSGMIVGKSSLWYLNARNFYEMCDENDAKFKGTCLNNISSCYWKLHNLRMKLCVKVSSKALQELDNNNELACTSAPL